MFEPQTATLPQPSPEPAPVATIATIDPAVREATLEAAGDELALQEADQWEAIMQEPSANIAPEQEPANMSEVLGDRLRGTEWVTTLSAAATPEELQELRTLADEAGVTIWERAPGAGIPEVVAAREEQLVVFRGSRSYGYTVDTKTTNDLVGDLKEAIQNHHTMDLIHSNDPEQRLQGISEAADLGFEGRRMITGSLQRGSVEMSEAIFEHYVSQVEDLHKIECCSVALRNPDGAVHEVALNAIEGIDSHDLAQNLDYLASGKSPEVREALIAVAGEIAPELTANLRHEQEEMLRSLASRMDSFEREFGVPPQSASSVNLTDRAKAMAEVFSEMSDEELTLVAQFRAQPDSSRRVAVRAETGLQIESEQEQEALTRSLSRAEQLASTSSLESYNLAKEDVRAVSEFLDSLALNPREERSTVVAAATVAATGLPRESGIEVLKTALLNPTLLPGRSEQVISNSNMATGSQLLSPTEGARLGAEFGSKPSAGQNQKVAMGIGAGMTGFTLNQLKQQQAGGGTSGTAQQGMAGAAGAMAQGGYSTLSSGMNPVAGMMGGALGAGVRMNRGSVAEIFALASDIDQDALIEVVEHGYSRSFRSAEQATIRRHGMGALTREFSDSPDPLPPEVAQLTRNVFRYQDTDCMDLAVDLLPRMGMEGAQIMNSVMNDPDPEARINTLRMPGIVNNFEDAEASWLTNQLLGHSDPVVRASAVGTLRGSHEEVATRLSAIIRNDPEQYVREKAGEMASVMYHHRNIEAFREPAELWSAINSRH